ncbi:hypothetical protein R3P38DRAFT_2655584 [Favolaschia claudopus]|uniref:Uncharacterized protein n=1 Tax=Favolaschia claudopus TaxID=2862362 RepID=A0AAV9ZZ91_9AGAR
MPHTQTPKPATGPPQALIERLNYLGQLLVHLPNTLPVVSDAAYRFYLDEDRVVFAGSVAPELERALDASFGTWENQHLPVRFRERGPRVQALVSFLKAAVKRMAPTERKAFETRWLDKLVQGAKDSGATIPSRHRASESSDPVKEQNKRRVESEHGSDESDSAQPLRKKSKKVLRTVVDSDSDTDLPEPSSLLTAAPRQTLVPNAVLPPTADVDLMHNQQATLARMGWQEWAPGAKEAHQKEASELYRAGMEEAQRKREQDKANQEEKKRLQGAERQRRHRAKKRAEREEEEGLSDGHNAHVVLLRGADAQARENVVDVADTSRPKTQAWRLKRNGTRGGAVVQKTAASVNYFHPFLFMHIDKAMRRVGWSPTEAVKVLKREHGALFKTIAKGTISKWRVTGKQEWTAATLKKVTAGRAIAASGRTGILAPYPDITESVKVTLKGLREAGAMINVSIVRGLLLAEITEQQPQLTMGRESTQAK